MPYAMRTAVRLETPETPFADATILPVVVVVSFTDILTLPAGFVRMPERAIELNVSPAATPQAAVAATVLPSQSFATISAPLPAASATVTVPEQRHVPAGPTDTVGPSKNALVLLSATALAIELLKIPEVLFRSPKATWANVPSSRLNLCVISQSPHKQRAPCRPQALPLLSDAEPNVFLECRRRIAGEDAVLGGLVFVCRL